MQMYKFITVVTLRDSSIIVAFIFSLLAFTVVTIILIMILFSIHQKYRTHPTNGSSSKSGFVCVCVCVCVCVLGARGAITIAGANRIYFIVLKCLVAQCM